MKPEYQFTAFSPVQVVTEEVGIVRVINHLLSILRSMERIPRSGHPKTGESKESSD